MSEDEKGRTFPERKQAFAGRQRERGKGLSQGREPMGSGPPNRHGMPTLPPGQRAVEKWPVLDLGDQPLIERSTWTLEVEGLVARPLTLSWSQFLALPQTDDVSDFHCVTTWSKMDMRWRGVRFADLMAAAGPLATASHVFVTAHDEDDSSGEPYTTNLSLEDAMSPDVMLVHSHDGRPLPREHGGPCRMITPRLYAWKGAKWIRRISLLDHDRRGFWERRGYSNTAIPWYDDRYSRGG